MSWNSNPPPFGKWVLAKIGKQYPEVLLVTRHSPNGEAELEQYLSSNRQYYEDYQFYLQPSLYQDTWDMNPEDHSGFIDVFSDSIIEWDEVPE